MRCAAAERTAAASISALAASVSRWIRSAGAGWVANSSSTLESVASLPFSFSSVTRIDEAS